MKCNLVSIFHCFRSQVLHRSREICRLSYSKSHDHALLNPTFKLLVAVLHLILCCRLSINSFFSSSFRPEYPTRDTDHTTLSLLLTPAIFPYHQCLCNKACLQFIPIYSIIYASGNIDSTFIEKAAKLAVHLHFFLKC